MENYDSDDISDRLFDIVQENRDLLEENANFKTLIDQLHEKCQMYENENRCLRSAFHQQQNVIDVINFEKQQMENKIKYDEARMNVTKAENAKLSSQLKKAFKDLQTSKNAEFEFQQASKTFERERKTLISMTNEKLKENNQLRYVIAEMTSTCVGFQKQSEKTISINMKLEQVVLQQKKILETEIKPIQQVGKLPLLYEMPQKDVSADAARDSHQKEEEFQDMEKLNSTP